MAIRINVNIASQIAQLNLRQNNRRLEKVYEQLSSGERINRAGDDASGLALSEILRSHSRSIDQAARNTGDGASLLDTAESALSNMEDMIQRVRELSIQASNDSNSTQERVAIQKEIDQQINEIKRLSTSVQFNRRNLLDGTFTNQRLQVGMGEGDFLALSIADVRPSAIGQIAKVTGASPVTLQPIAGNGDLTINGFNVPATEGDGVSFAFADSSAIAKAAAINRLASQTGVTAETGPAVFQELGSSVTGVALDGTTSALFINGVNIGAVNVTANDSTGALRDAINRFSGETGVVASLAASGELIMTAADGRNFQITTTGSVADELGLAAADSDLTAQVVSGTLTLQSPSPIAVAGTDTSLIGFLTAQANTLPDPTTAFDQINVTTREGAEAAIASADSALNQISNIRAELGAMSNRLEATLTQLQTNSENIKASDSRIRDTDFAEASARATQQQIIQQAATAILAQANMIPQMALQLLQQ